MKMHVVGGLYRERCVKPNWDALFGSGGRAAQAITQMGQEVSLHTYATQQTASSFMSNQLFSPGKLEMDVKPAATTVLFDYVHDSGRPKIKYRPNPKLETFRIDEDSVIRFGMLDGDAIVNAGWAVYDPQNEGDARRFTQNGSKAEHLALVLSLSDARKMIGDEEASYEICALKLADSDGAEVVIIKLGPVGAYVWNKQVGVIVPAFRTKNAWKIGGGDVFVAHFALAWITGATPVDAVTQAFKASAYYSENKLLPFALDLGKFQPDRVKISQNFFFLEKPTVYLTGQLSDTAQLWLAEEVSANLIDLGLKVISPINAIRGGVVNLVDAGMRDIPKSDLVFAIVDKIDSGTIYQLGYAASKGKKIVLLCESGETKMASVSHGDEWVTCDNYTTALYSTIWAAAAFQMT